MGIVNFGIRDSFFSVDFPYDGIFMLPLQKVVARSDSHYLTLLLPLRHAPADPPHYYCSSMRPLACFGYKLQNKKK